MVAYYIEFWGRHPWIAFWMTLITGYIVTAPFRYAFRAWNRHLRSKNIQARGWPPKHCDADGDPRAIELDDEA